MENNYQNLIIFIEIIYIISININKYYHNIIIEAYNIIINNLIKIILKKLVLKIYIGMLKINKMEVLFGIVLLQKIQKKYIKLIKIY